jgi:hypothetical protein
MESLIFEEIETKVKKAVNDHEPLRKSASKRTHHDRDDDRGR